MIKLQDLTPKVYYEQSRDFQLIGRLYDLLFTAVKTNADMLRNIPLSDNSDDSLLDLAALTLGFQSRHNYNADQLKAICSIFSLIMRNKGSISAVILACNALLHAEGINYAIKYELRNQGTELVLFVPQELTDFNLFRDLLSYILPAGMSCNIVKEIQQTQPATTNAYVTGSVDWHVASDRVMSVIPTLGDSKLIDANPHATPGFFMNSVIIKPDVNSTTYDGTELTDNSSHPSTEQTND